MYGVNCIDHISSDFLEIFTPIEQTENWLMHRDLHHYIYVRQLTQLNHLWNENVLILLWNYKSCVTKQRSKIVIIIVMLSKRIYINIFIITCKVSVSSKEKSILKLVYALITTDVRNYWKELMNRWMNTKTKCVNGCTICTTEFLRWDNDNWTQIHQFGYQLQWRIENFPKLEV